MLRYLIFILTFIFASFQAQAKVCFLPDVMGNNPDCLGELAIEGCTYSRTTACGAGYHQSECIRHGKKYYDCKCKVTGEQKAEISRNGNTKFHCDNPDFVPECGCPAEDIKCNKSIFKYKKADCLAIDSKILVDITQEGFPADLACTDQTGTYFRKCQCPDEFQYECKETGLKGPSTTDKCKDSDNKTFYRNCDCADTWIPGGCEYNVNGCTVSIDHIKRPGIESLCHLCGPEKCDDPNQIDLNRIWCSATEGNCQTMGYSTTTPVQCGDNSTALSCPFDVNYRFCPALTCAIGDVFYADGTCGKVEDYTASKMPIGVVFMLTDGNGLFKPSATVSNHGKILSLKDLKKNSDNVFDPVNPFDGENVVAFGRGTSGSKLADADDATLVKAYKNFQSDFYKGKELTAAIAKSDYFYIGCGGNIERSAAQVALAFYPHMSLAGDPKFGAGNWYIPSMGELIQFVGTDVNSITSVNGSSGATKTNVNKINAVLESLEAKGVAASALEVPSNATGYMSSFEQHTCGGMQPWGVMLSGDRQLGCPSRCYNLPLRVVADF